MDRRRVQWEVIGMNEIKMIPIGDLEHHPENPRKDLGDLSELTESIRKNGVYQNLTVVADLKRCKYLVVIGNRRMEAAKAAGLIELPCVISDMDHKEQIATMLEENMQRQDLTVYEQAQGFQMMMDLGYSAKEISERTGFSETTVNRRLKMAELDKDTFQKAVGKQITMDDLDRLGQLESVKERNALLKEFGENNFDWKLNRAIKVQKAKKVKRKAHKMLQDAKIEKIPEKDRYSLYSGGYEKLYQQTLELDKWDGKRNFIPKVDGKLFYDEDETDISFYVKKKKQKAEPVRKSEEELEQEKQIALAWKVAERSTAAARELREAFAEGMKVSPSKAMEMLQWALIAAMCMALDYDTPTETIRKNDQIPISGYNTQENLENVHKWITSIPQSKWPGIILMMFQGDHNNGYVDGPKAARPRHKPNKKLDLCYQWLQQFGYRMSDEEEQLRDGTHQIFTGADQQ